MLDDDLLHALGNIAHFCLPSVLVSRSRYGMVTHGMI